MTLGAVEKMLRDAPMALAVVSLIAVGCQSRRSSRIGTRRGAKPNQQQSLPSPSGAYVLTVPIGRNPNDRDLPFWRLTISDPRGSVLYEDTDSSFVGHLNVYWCWGEGDRAWLYNSDDGCVYYWDMADGNWKKQHWGRGRAREIAQNIAPPDMLYPSYVR
jgi:hypothetical protein